MVSVCVCKKERERDYAENKKKKWKKLLGAEGLQLVGMVESLMMLGFSQSMVIGGHLDQEWYYRQKCNQEFYVAHKA